MRPIARMRLHLWVRPQLPGQGSARASSCYRTGSLSGRWLPACYRPRWGVLPFPLFPGLPLDFPLPLDLFLPF